MMPYRPARPLSRVLLAEIAGPATAFLAVLVGLPCRALAICAGVACLAALAGGATVPAVALVLFALALNRAANATGQARVWARRL